MIPGIIWGLSVLTIHVLLYGMVRYTVLVGDPSMGETPSKRYWGDYKECWREVPVKVSLVAYLCAPITALFIIRQLVVGEEKMYWGAIKIVDSEGLGVNRRTIYANPLTKKVWICVGGGWESPDAVKIRIRREYFGYANTVVTEVGKTVQELGEEYISTIDELLAS